MEGQLALILGVVEEDQVEQVQMRQVQQQVEQEEQVLLIQYQDHQCHMVEAVAAEDQAVAEQVQRAVEQDTED